MKLKDVNDVRALITKTFRTVDYAKFKHSD